MDIDSENNWGFFANPQLAAEDPIISGTWMGLDPCTVLKKNSLFYQ